MLSEDTERCPIAAVPNTTCGGLVFPLLPAPLVAALPPAPASALEAASPVIMDAANSKDKP